MTGKLQKINETLGGIVSLVLILAVAAVVGKKTEYAKPEQNFFIPTGSGPILVQGMKEDAQKPKKEEKQDSGKAESPLMIAIEAAYVTNNEIRQDWTGQLYKKKKISLRKLITRESSEFYSKKEFPRPKNVYPPRDWNVPKKIAGLNKIC